MFYFLYSFNCDFFFLILGVIRGEEDRVLNQTQMSHYQATKKLENWEDQILNNNNNNNNPSPVAAPNFVDIVKQEFSNRDHSLILQPASTTLTTSHPTNKFLNFTTCNNSNNSDHNNNQAAVGGRPDLSPEVSFVASLASLWPLLLDNFWLYLYLVWTVEPLRRCNGWRV